MVTTIYSDVYTVRFWKKTNSAIIRIIIFKKCNFAIPVGFISSELQEFMENENKKTSTIICQRHTQH